MRGAAMSLTAAVSGFVIFLLSVSVIQGQSDWGVTYTSTEICALKGSTAEMRCSYRDPFKTNVLDTKIYNKLWFPEEIPQDLRGDLKYLGRVQYDCDKLKNDCTLRITDLRKSDSAEYYCSFIITAEGGRITGVPGVTLSVTDLQVQMSGSDDWVEMTCHTRCSLPGQPSFVWYKNGQKVQENALSYHPVIHPADSYYCAVKGHEDLPSPLVSAPSVPSVSVSPSAEIVEGSSVTLTCRSDANPAATYTWYKENGNLKPLSEEPQLVFSSIQSSDSGQYDCTAENELGRRTSNYISIDVKYAPKRPSVSVSPSAKIVEGSSVTLTCRSDANPAATYSWFKGKKKLSQGPEGSFHFTSISSEDRGFYYCKSENPHGQIRSSSPLIDVQYAPRLPSVSVSPSAEIVEGSSVALTCHSDANPPVAYTWYKEKQRVFQGPEGGLYFTSISSEESGIYYCKSENPYGQIISSSLLIDVQYAPKLPSVSVSPSAEIVEGSSVTLTCSSDANPAANYTWYKKNEDPPKASGQIFTITDFTAEHSGNYYCEAQNTRGRHNSTLHLTVVAGNSIMIMNIIRVTLVVLMLIPLLLLILWMRKKKTLSFTTEQHEPVEIELDSCPVYENASDSAAQTEDRGAGRPGVKSSQMQLNQRRDSPDGNKVVRH